MVRHCRGNLLSFWGTRARGDTTRPSSLLCQNSSVIHESWCSADSGRWTADSVNVYGQVNLYVPESESSCSKDVLASVGHTLSNWTPMWHFAHSSKWPKFQPFSPVKSETENRSLIQNGNCEHCWRPIPLFSLLPPKMTSQVRENKNNTRLRRRRRHLVFVIHRKRITSFSKVCNSDWLSRLKSNDSMYRVDGVNVQQETERNEATAKYVALPSCAWLLLNFFPFPGWHPLCRNRRLESTRVNLSRGSTHRIWVDWLTIANLSLHREAAVQIGWAEDGEKEAK